MICDIRCAPADAEKGRQMSDETDNTPWLSRQIEETKKSVNERPQWMKNLKGWEGEGK